jgi:hypothetical protein
MINQVVGVLISIAIASVGSLIILKFVDLMIGVRVSPETEVAGLDITQHGEEGYDWPADASCQNFNPKLKGDLILGARTPSSANAMRSTRRPSKNQARIGRPYKLGQYPVWEIFASSLNWD